MSDAADVDPLETLQESDYDFGHFDELDSDIETEPEVDENSIDPFTAAQRAESNSLLLRPENDAQDVGDDKLAFTQKLLSNAKSLRQLSQGDKPAVEIEYEDARPREVSSDSTSQSSRSSSPLGQYSGTRLSSAQKPPIRQSSSQRSTGPSGGQAEYVPASKVLFESVKLLAKDTPIDGKYHVFPAGYLNNLSFSQFQRVLNQTRRYQDGLELNLHAPCVQEVWAGADITSAPILLVLSTNDRKVLLQDEHKEGPDDRDQCRVLALLPEHFDPIESLNPGTYVKLQTFYFDHAITTTRPRVDPSRTVKMEEVEDEAFPAAQPAHIKASQRHNAMNKVSAKQRVGFVAADNADDDDGDDHDYDTVALEAGPKGPPNTLATPLHSSVLPTSLLVIETFKVVDWNTIQASLIADRDARERAHRMYDDDGMDEGDEYGHGHVSGEATYQQRDGEHEVGSITQGTAETDYSQPDAFPLDPEDFPIEVQDGTG